MAIKFDGTADRYTIADHDDMSFPDAAWSIGFWTFIDANAGTSTQYLFSTGLYQVIGVFNLFLYNASWAGPEANRWELSLRDGTNQYTILPAEAPGADSIWRLFVVQREAADTEVHWYWCTYGGTPVDKGNTSGWAGINSTTGPSLGARADGARWYQSRMCEVWKGAFELTGDEIAALGKGVRIVDLKKGGFQMYHPMPAPAATLRDIVSARDATQAGGNQTAVEHAPLSMSWTPTMVIPSAPTRQWIFGA